MITQALASGQIKVVPSEDSKTVQQSGGVNYGESNEIRAEFSMIFAGTNPGGSIEGYIDKGKIWRSEE